MAFISEIREYTIEFNEVQNAIKDGACAALVNKNIPSVKDSRPRFLTNDRQKEQKVLIDKEDTVTGGGKRHMVHHRWKNR